MWTEPLVHGQPALLHQPSRPEPDLHAGLYDRSLPRCPLLLSGRRRHGSGGEPNLLAHANALSSARQELLDESGLFHRTPHDQLLRLSNGGWHQRFRQSSVLARREDRKSTRLNSSHITISYAVFCLKKKKKTHATSSHHHSKTYRTVR